MHVAQAENERRIRAPGRQVCVRNRCCSGFPVFPLQIRLLVLPLSPTTLLASQRNITSLHLMRWTTRCSDGRPLSPRSSCDSSKTCPGKRLGQGRRPQLSGTKCLGTDKSTRSRRARRGRFFSVKGFLAALGMPLRGQIIAIVLLMAVLPALGLTKREEIAKGRKCGSAPKGSTHEEPHRQAGEISFPRPPQTTFILSSARDMVAGEVHHAFVAGRVEF